MHSKRRKPATLSQKQPPPYVLALDDHDPLKAGNIYDKQPSFLAPDVKNQLSFKRGDQLKVVADELDWWILCEKLDSDEKGYVPTILFAPLGLSSPNDR